MIFKAVTKITAEIDFFRKTVISSALVFRGIVYTFIGTNDHHCYKERFGVST